MTLERPQRIGVIGTGIMGGPMARRLAEAGFTVSSWNRTSAKAEALLAAGVSVVGSPVAAANGADVVICMLSSGPVCDVVLVGADGVIAAMAPGSVLVVMSSIPPETARMQGKAASERGIAYVDAPVSGGERGAIAGTLAIMAGGNTEVVAKLAPVLTPLGRITRVGPVGAGSLTKLANQAIVATTIAAVAEAFLLAESGGANLACVREALLGGFADSTILRQHGRRMAESDFAPGGPAKYQVKDTSTALECAHDLGLNLPLLRRVDDLFRAMVENGGADLDHSAILLELRRMNRDGGTSVSVGAE